MLKYWIIYSDKPKIKTKPKHMKKLIAFLLVAFVTETTIAQNYNPAVAGGTITPAPISTGYANIQFTVGNTGNDPLSLTAHPGQPMLLVVSLSNGIPNNVNPLAAISGTFASKFTWQYDPAVKSYLGTQTQTIGGVSLGTIIIAYKVTVASTAANPNNGFNVNITPPGYTNASNAPGDDNVSSYTFGNEPIIVPIKLLSFTAAKQGKVVNLNWVTTSEINSSHFDVQYSKNGTQWQSIGIVAAAGNSSTQRNYSFVHTTPITGVNYYRLKQVDIDAKFENSLIRTATFSTSTGISVFPNPSTDKVFINSDVAGKLQSVTVYSKDGKQMVHVNNFSVGNSIDMHRYGPGVYLLKIVDKEGNATTTKVVKH